MIALGAFYVMTAAPTVWDAADDYFPASAPIQQHVQPLPAMNIRPAVVAAPAVARPAAAATLAKVTKKDDRHLLKPGTRLSTRRPGGATTAPGLQRRST